MISPASVDDAPRMAALLGSIYDGRLITVAGVRHRQASIRPEERVGTWLAERDGELLGLAFGGLDAFASASTAAFAGVAVHPDHRREGIGSALWDAVTAHLDEIGARRVVAHSRADADTKAFAARRGFTLEATETASAVDPRTIPAPAAAPEGIEIAPMSRFVDDPELVFVADRECMLDEPGPSDFSGVTYETWRRMIWDIPDADRELSVAALARGSVVGTTLVYADRAQGRAANAGTGVISAFRGQGLGLLMKQHSLTRAAAAGITRVITQNDATNAPMLAINARLGYEPFAVAHAWVLER
jgi:GNAT superfamily N-acetyltransferase